MHWEQRDAFTKAHDHMSKVAIALQKSYDLTEEEALELVESTSGIIPLAANREPEDIYSHVVNEARLPKPTRIPFDQSNPKQDTYPEHPNFVPTVTTKAVFNDHMAQALTPYASAIVKKIADERGLQPPDTQVVKRVLAKTDWAKASYEMRGMGSHPPPGKIKSFLDKYIFDPIDSTLDSVFVKKLWPVVTGVQTMLMIFLAVATYMDKFVAPAGKLASGSSTRLMKSGARKAFRGLLNPSRLNMLQRRLQTIR